MTLPVPTREAGLARLAGFLPNAGRAYAASRNADRGPDDRDNVSMLSPYLRRRLVLEEEALAAVMGAHGFAAAEKFIQEIFWRAYWKGWLEMRPSVLRRFDAERRRLSRSLAEDHELAAVVRAAEAGETGIDCFDDWARELDATGYLHNHARMWFASIWIFTLRLPWALGADFMFKRLACADPASNTLSWRWVAGLHTRGKHYLARAENIRTYTGGRFNPAGELDERAAPLVDDWPTLPGPLPDAPSHWTGRRCALLLTEEDLHAESWRFEGEVVGVAGLAPSILHRSDSPAALFAHGALQDGLARASAHFGAPNAGVLAPDGLRDWAKGLEVEAILTGYAPEGLAKWTLDAAAPALPPLARLRRGYDSRAWPHAKAGFFKLKEQIPLLLRALERG